MVCGPTWGGGSGRTINKEHRWWGVLPGPQAIPHVVLLRVRVRKKEPRKYSERGRAIAYVYVCVCASLNSVRELWLPPSRAFHTRTRVTRTPALRARSPPRVSGDDDDDDDDGGGGGRVHAELRGMRSVSGENREKFRRKEGRPEEKNCTCNYPSSGRAGKWDSFGQPDLLSLPRPVAGSLCGTN